MDAGSAAGVDISSVRMKRCAALLLPLTLLAFVACWSSRPQTDEAYAVYSTYLRSQILHNAHDYGRGGGVVVIRQMTTTPSAQEGIAHVIEENLEGLDASTLADFMQVAGHSVALEKKFSLPIMYGLASESDIASGKVKSDYGYIALSRVGFNARGTQALFHLDHFCPLCGGSGYVLMKKNIFGSWRVQREYFTMMS
jgi:hypothetical protein